MEHKDHLGLIRGGIPPRQPSDQLPVWADLGAGEGAFTLALADLLGPGAQIYAVDRDARALAQQAQTMAARFPQTRLTTLNADFTRPLDLPPLDGIVMANALHFVADSGKDAVLQRLRRTLRPGGRLIVVEYNADSGNTWVPHPFSYRTWEKMARRNGLTQTRLLASVPSRFLGEIYAAASTSEAPPL